MKKESHLQLVKSGNELPLSIDENRMLEHLFDAWRNRRLGALRQKPQSVGRDINVVKDFVRFTKKPPWRWQPEHFDQWCFSLVARGVVPASERTYQTAIRTFLEYVSGNIRLREEVAEKFNASLIQICTDDNCIPHAFEKENQTGRRPLTHEEVKKFFDALDREITAAANTGSKSLLPLQRDKAFWYTLYVGGLRISEAIGTNTYSYLPNQDFPQFKKYGRVQVLGKGGKQRVVVVDKPELPPMLEWYETDVRPRFLRRADPNEDAFFLNERGHRVTRSAMESQFKKILAVAGLDHLDFTPHCLRGSMITHGSMWITPLAMQHKAGHVYLATTEGYADYPDPFVRSQVNNSIRKQLDAAKDPDADGGEGD